MTTAPDPTTAPSAATDLPSGAATHDVVIVGGSMAGLTAALVLGRARRSVLVIDSGSPINAGVLHSQGFPTRDGTPPAELVAMLRDEVAVYGVEVADDLVVGAERTDAGFLVRRADGPPAVGRTLLLASGARQPLPDLPGLAEVWGDEAANCPYCHGWELRDRPLVALGGPPMLTLGKARMLTQWSPDVTAIVEVDPDAEAELAPFADAARRAGVVVRTATPTRVVLDDGRLAGIELADGATVSCRGLFVGGMPEASTGLATSLGVALAADGMAAGFPLVDRDGTTSVAGVWAIGNAADPSHQLTGAADSGTRAARMVNHHLLDLDHP